MLFRIVPTCFLRHTGDTVGLRDVNKFFNLPLSCFGQHWFIKFQEASYHDLDKGLILYNSQFHCHQFYVFFFSTQLTFSH